MRSCVFSIVHAVLLRPLDFPEPERLVLLFERNARFPKFSVSVPNFIDFRQQNTVLEDLAAMDGRSFNLAGRSAST